MRYLLVLGSTVALLAGCTTSDSEPATEQAPEDAADTGSDADDAEETEEPRPADDSADDDTAAGTETDGEDTPDETEDAPDETEDAPEEPEDADEGTSSPSAEVEIGDFFFDDDDLAIEVGDTVTWTHQGDVTHNVTSRDELFVSDNLSSGDTFTHTFDTAGSFGYFCTLHGQMEAKIQVS